MSRSRKDHGLIAMIERAASIYHKAEPYLNRNSLFVFVCGAAKSTPPQKPSLREQFLKEAEELLPATVCLLAESAAADVGDSGEPRFVNLALFEKAIAEIADVILIFTESPGSIAELGYFCAKPEILKKLLVVRDREFENIDSFINVGLIDQVNRDSLFRPAMALDAQATGIDFSQITKRIERHKNPSLRLRPFKKTNFNKMPLRDQFVFLHFLLHILGDATYKEIVLSIKALCQDAKNIKFDDVLSILCSTRMVSRNKLNPESISYNTASQPLLLFHSLAIDEMRTVFIDAAQREKSDAA